jgi:hypothetical protein
MPKCNQYREIDEKIKKHSLEKNVTALIFKLGTKYKLHMIFKVLKAVTWLK